MVNVLILQTQWCKLKMPIHVLAMWDTVIGEVQTQKGIASRCSNQPQFEETVASVMLDSQVLVGVMLALAVGRGVQEGQLLTGALQLQNLTAQVQAALWTQKNHLYYICGSHQKSDG